jgi:hypothetical protein
MCDIFQYPFISLFITCVTVSWLVLLGGSQPAKARTWHPQDSRSRVGLGNKPQFKKMCYYFYFKIIKIMFF